MNTRFNQRGFSKEITSKIYLTWFRPLFPVLPYIQSKRTVYFHTLRAQLPVYLLFFNPITISLSLEFIGQQAWRIRSRVRVRDIRWVLANVSCTCATVDRYMNVTAQYMSQYVIFSRHLPLWVSQIITWAAYCRAPINTAYIFYVLNLRIYLSTKATYARRIEQDIRFACGTCRRLKLRAVGVYSAGG